MRLTPVRTRRDLADFLAFPDRLHGHDPRYIPTMHQQIRGWHGGEVPGVRLHLLRDAAGEVVARTTLHTDPDFDRKLGRPVQLFGLTEFVDDDTVTKTLFEEICMAGLQAGRASVFGPVSLLPNQSGGVITSGFDQRGFVDSGWNPAYYPDAYASNGFKARFPSETWICDHLQDDPRSVHEVFPFEGDLFGDLELHRGSRRHLAEQLPILRGMLNASFAQLGYYTEISAEQLARQTDGLAYLIDESLLLYLTKAGRPAAFVLCIPDISDFVRKTSGNLNAVNQLRLLVSRSRYRREAILVIKGTVPGEQGHGYQRLLSRELLKNLRAGGYDTLRSTYVERTNPASAAQYRAMGGRPLHGYAFYEKEI
ncbi:hypothetical protein GCM10009765_27850 [Fodinicola feengrottensis]|uniref:N-acetyltransferase domain-containing protein n=1 Tax=Fodinicola feengrottensis TaxID=435914 RepID=A0ABP4SW53_9ACTN